MTRRRAALLLAALAILLLPAGAAAGKSFLSRVLSFLGVTSGPGQLKRAADRAEPGRLYTKSLLGGAERALTPAAPADYRWPVFSLDGKSIYALRGDTLVTLNATTGKEISRKKVAKVDKLVGVDRDHPDEMLVLLADPAGPALLSIKSAKVTPLPYDPEDADQVRMLSHLAGEERVYGTARISSEPTTEDTVGGSREVQKIYLQVGDDGAPTAVSACAGGNCREPALSADGKRAVWVWVGE